jgi:K+-sensing histidine kinase KdpD
MIQDCPLRFTTTAKMVIAILASAVALLVTAWLPAIDHTPMYALLVLSVMIAAWAGGWKAGLLAATLNSAGVAYFLLPPNGSLLIAAPGQAVHFAVTTLVMVVVAILMQIVRLHPTVEIGLRAEAVQPHEPTLRRGHS